MTIQENRAPYWSQPTTDLLAELRSSRSRLKRDLLDSTGPRTAEEIACYSNVISAGIPGLSLPSGFGTSSLMAYTVVRRPSTVCTLRGVNSA
jgi:hypothetical protein